MFLDELGELDKNIQVKLLRFLEVGRDPAARGHPADPVDVRVICATNRDLRQMIAEGDFREDLLYRLNTFHIHLPPLRDRKADIPDLARHLLARAAKRPMEQVADLLTPEALHVMLEYDWQGNVRELANAMEYAWIVSGGGPITAGPPAAARPHAGNASRPAAGGVAARHADHPADAAPSAAPRRSTTSRWSTSSGRWRRTAATSRRPRRSWGSA